MKKVILFVVLMLFVGQALAADITFTIDNAKLPRVVAAMAGLYEIPKDENDVPLFTENQWAKEAVRRWLIKCVRRWEASQAMKAASNAIKMEDDLIQ